jgi:hypothetical protein
MNIEAGPGLDRAIYLTVLLAVVALISLLPHLRQGKRIALLE